MESFNLKTPGVLNPTYQVDIIKGNTGAGDGVKIFSDSAFNPVTVPNTIAYWDNDSSYMAANGSSWTDRVGGFDMAQASAPARPVYTPNAIGTRPGFVFDGVGQFMARNKLVAIEGIPALTIITVGNTQAWSQDPNGASAGMITLAYHPNGKVFNYINDANEQVGVTVDVIGQINNYTIMVFDGTQTGNANRLKCYVNGVQKTLDFGARTVPALTGSNASSSIYMGEFTTLFMAGTMCQTQLITRAISAGEITSFSTFLASRYGL